MINWIEDMLTCEIIERDKEIARLRIELHEANREIQRLRAIVDRWQTDHIEGNEEIRRLRKRCEEARPFAEYCAFEEVDKDAEEWLEGKP